MHALLTAGRSKICCIPGLVAFVPSWNAGGSLEANMYEGLPEGSSGSGGICTKCRISEAEVPMYRFWSAHCQLLIAWVYPRPWLPRLKLAYLEILHT